MNKVKFQSIKVDSGDVSVKSILRIINSCEDQEEINLCEQLITKYIKVVKRKGLSNINDLQLRLTDELIERQEAIYLSDIL